jgi:HSP20 family protein
MEDGEHPFFSGNPSDSEAPPAGPWGHGPWGAGPWGGRRGHRGWHHHNMAHRGPPDAAGPQSRDDAAAAESPATATGDETEKNIEKDIEMEGKDIPDPPEDTPKDPEDGGCAHKRHCGHARRHGRREGIREGGCEGRRGERGWHHHHGGPFRGGPHRGPWGAGWGGFGPQGFRMLNNLFQPQTQETANESGDWSPEADVFDTPGAFVVHVSLPGANKEDVGVTWDPERSELQIAGVVHRPGDEEFLKTLAMDERKVGAFERKVRLGTRAHPAHVDIDGISAKFENGILIVEVPKMLGEFVEVKKVDIE